MQNPMPGTLVFLRDLKDSTAPLTKRCRRSACARAVTAEPSRARVSAVPAR